MSLKLLICLDVKIFIFRCMGDIVYAHRIITSFPVKSMDFTLFLSYSYPLTNLIFINLCLGKNTRKVWSVVYFNNKFNKFLRYSFYLALYCLCWVHGHLKQMYKIGKAYSDKDVLCRLLQTKYIGCKILSLNKIHGFKNQNSNYNSVFFFFHV